MPLGQSRFITGIGVSKSGLTLLARILGNAGTPIVQASISSISITLNDTVTGSTTTVSPAPVVSTAVYNSLQQTDPRWTVDSAAFPGLDGTFGYNFAFTIPASNFPTTDAQNILVTFLPVTGENLVVPYRVSFIA